MLSLFVFLLGRKYQSQEVEDHGELPVEMKPVQVSVIKTKSCHIIYFISFFLEKIIKY